MKTLHNYYIDEITIPMIDAALQEASYLNLNTSNRNKIINFMEKAFDYAEQRGYVRINIVRNIDRFPEKKTKQKEEKPIVSPEQMMLFSNEIRYRTHISKERANMYADCIEFLFYTGMRMAECLGVRFCDITEDNCIDLKQQWYKHGRQDLKTPCSIRMVSLNKKCLDIIERLKKEQEDKPGFNKEWYLFYGKKPIDQNTIGKQLDWAYGKLLEKDEIVPRITPHILRHSITSLLISKNVPIATVARQLGHTNESITLRTYTHEIEEDKSRVTNVLNEI